MTPKTFLFALGPMTVDESNHATGVIILPVLKTLNGHMRIILLSKLHLQHVQNGTLELRVCQKKSFFKNVTSTSSVKAGNSRLLVHTFVVFLQCGTADF